MTCLYVKITETETWSSVPTLVRC
uniref:Uncharacterized protein n=1 Tax=Lepeophtheirus salmonis TaxID=72036 RepID=A0A0K2TAR0_LEPSM